MYTWVHVGVIEDDRLDAADGTEYIDTLEVFSHAAELMLGKWYLAPIEKGIKYAIDHDTGSGLLAIDRWIFQR